MTKNNNNKYNANGEICRYSMFKNSGTNRLQFEENNFISKPQVSEEKLAETSKNTKKDIDGKENAPSDKIESTEKSTSTRKPRDKQVNRIASLEVLKTIIQSAEIMKNAANRAAADTENKNFRRFLQAQIEKYDMFSNEAKDLGLQYELKTDSSNTVIKFLHNANVSIKLFAANTSSKVAETLILETVFLSISLIRLIRSSKNIQPDIMIFARKTMICQENDVQLLKSFL